MVRAPADRWLALVGIMVLLSISFLVVDRGDLLSGLPVWQLIALGVLSAFNDRLHFFPLLSGEFPLAAGITLAVMVGLNEEAALLVAQVTAAVSCLRPTRRGRHTLNGTVVFLFAIMAAGLAFRLTAAPLHLDRVNFFLGCVVVTAVYHTSSVLLIAWAQRSPGETGNWPRPLEPQMIFALLVCTAAVGAFLQLRNHADLPIFLAALAIHWLLISPFYSKLRAHAVNRLLAALEERHPWRQQHADRVAQYAAAIAEPLGLSGEETWAVRYAALLHDVVADDEPDSIMVEPGSLPPGELQRLEGQILEGARLVRRIPGMGEVAEAIQHHHERYDGSGFPSGLVGEAIPLSSRILAVADTFDNLTSYHSGRLAPSEALEIMLASSGLRFCPVCLRALARIVQERRADGRDLVAEATESLRADLRNIVRRLQTALRGLQEGRRHPAAALSGSKDHGLIAGLAALEELGQALNSSLDAQRVAQVVVDIASGALSGPVALALRVQYGQLHLVARRGWPGDLHTSTALPPNSLTMAAVQSRRPQFSLDTTKDTRVAAEEVPEGGPFRAMLCQPLICREQATGSLNIYRRSGFFSSEESTLVGLIATQAALALENALLYSEVRARLHEITASSRLLELVLANVASGIIAIDDHGVVTMGNQQAAIFLGMDRESIIGLHYRQLIAFDGVDPVAEVMVAGKPHQLLDLQLGQPERSLELQAAPLRGEQGQPLGAVLLLRDVTQRQRMEEQIRQAEKLAIVGELAAGAAHEIRNPMTSIRGFAQLMRARSDDAGQIRYLEIILKEIDRIDEIVQGLLLMARPSVPRLGECNLNALIDDTCLLVQAAARLHQVAVVNSAPPLPPIHGDTTQLKQVLLNIITNAVQASPPGSSVIVEGSCSRDGQWVQLRVIDFGCGIPEESLGRIFDPFFTTKEAGTGLGLAVSYQIVVNHGGHIEVESQPGQGSVFAVHLPRIAK